MEEGGGGGGKGGSAQNHHAPPPLRTTSFASSSSHASYPAITSSMRFPAPSSPRLRPPFAAAESTRACAQLAGEPGSGMGSPSAP